MKFSHPLFQLNIALVTSSFFLFPLILFQTYCHCYRAIFLSQTVRPHQPLAAFNSTYYKNIKYVCMYASRYEKHIHRQKSRTFRAHLHLSAVYRITLWNNGISREFNMPAITARYAKKRVSYHDLHYLSTADLLFDEKRA